MSKSSKGKPPVAAQQSPARQQTAIAVEQHIHQGPLPDPGTLQRYEQALPGLAERIVALAEKEQNVRIFDVKMGRIGALVYSLAVCGVAAFAIYKESPQAGAVIIGLQVAAVCASMMAKHIKGR
ncbi:MAG: DUF2335 domain-containing protein [Candidatus Adiutrix sp.]|nr:DUF2335 domain-containing protein [Candidatus Adiutrix sp.]